MTREAERQGKRRFRIMQHRRESLQQKLQTQRFDGAASGSADMDILKSQSETMQRQRRQSGGDWRRLTTATLQARTKTKSA